MLQPFFFFQESEDPGLEALIHSQQIKHFFYQTVNNLLQLADMGAKS